MMPIRLARKDSCKVPVALLENELPSKFDSNKREGDCAIVPKASPTPLKRLDR